MALKLTVIIGSTRPGRVGPTIAQWAADFARENSPFEVEVADLAEIDLPLFDEPAHPSKQEYTHEHTKRWSGIVAASDAFVFVTPEYDFFPSAAVINAVQYLLHEWRRKPAAVVSYGGVSAGLRSSQVLRQLLGNVGMVALSQSVPIPFFPQFIGEDNTFHPNEVMMDGAKLMLTELNSWAESLKAMRDKAA
ncbi:NADPH-dependent FMN reductase [Consotaella aegiceratis]|uniref:NADPH-dependent FMN reductase n=1 Tax=Consotaella aegiceratis TaxID=3097961 RepID=UPI002F3FAD5F